MIRTDTESLTSNVLGLKVMLSIIIVHVIFLIDIAILLFDIFLLYMFCIILF